MRRKLAQTAPQTAGPGIETLLGEGARVFYENVFSTRHIGRTTDLVVFESADFIAGAADSVTVEHQIRQLAELAIFNGWTNYRAGDSAKAIEVEFGWDRARLVLQVSSFAEPGLSGLTPDDAAAGDDKAMRIRRWLEQLKSLSDGIIVGYNPKTGRLRVAVFVNSGASAVDAQPAAVAGVVPQALADAKVTEFLKEEKAMDAAPVSAPEGASDAPDVVTIAGGTDEVSDVMKVKSLDDGKTAEPEEVTIGPAPDSGAETADEIESAEIQENIELLLTTVKTDVIPMAPGLSKEEFDEAFKKLAERISESYNDTIQHLMKVKNIQLLSKIKHYTDQISLLQAQLEQYKAKDAGGETRIKGDAAAQDVFVIKGGVMGDEEFEALVTRQRQAVANMEMSQEVRGWAQGFLDEMARDRKSIQQYMRAMQANVQKRESDFKVKENAVLGQLRLHDEKFARGELKLEKMKEALASAMSLAESHRAAAALVGGDVTQLTSRLEASQRMLATANDKAAELERKVEELQQKVLAQGSDGSKASETEVLQLAQQRDRALRVIEDLKVQGALQQKQIIDLQTKLNKAVKGVGTGGGAAANRDDPQLRYKLEQSNKIVKAMKEELERTRRRFDELKLEETNLKVELGRLQTQLKTATKKG